MTKSQRGDGGLTSEPDFDETLVAGAPFEAAVGPRTGAVLANRFELRVLLGTGGMGSVYLAHDRELDEDVAVKLLHGSLSTSPEALDVLRQEVKLARRVTDTNVARIHELAEHEGEWFLTMEFIDGVALSDMMSREKRLPVARVIEVLVAVCRGLHAVHQAGVVHGDVKPANILVARDGRIVLSDFGIARFADATGGTDEVIGTPAYMAPEQVTGDSLGPATDLYAVGVVAFELLTNQLPFRGRNAIETASARLLRNAPDLLTVCPDLDPSLARVVTSALARDPLDRPVSASELARQLSEPTLETNSSIQSVDVVDLYLKAQWVYRRFERAEEAVELFAEAARAAPDSAIIHAGYAAALTRLWMMRGSDREVRHRAASAAARALELGPHLGETHMASGMLALHTGDPVRAAGSFQTALTRAPSLFDVHAITCSMLYEVGCITEGEQRRDVAMRLDPNLTVLGIETARASALSGDTREARAFIAREHQPGTFELVSAARLAAYLNDADALQRLHKRCLVAPIESLNPAARVFHRLVEILATDVKPTDALQLIPIDSDGISHRRHALTMQLRSEITAHLGLIEESISAVEIADRHGLIDRVWVEGCPLLAPMRASPRYAAVRERVIARANAVASALHAHPPA